LICHHTSFKLTHDLALRVEWAKAKAHAARWEEEVILLDEEMRRTLQFCSWKAKWWRDQQSLRVLATDHILSDGLKAFAEQQAAQEFDIAKDWEVKWRAMRQRARPIVDGILHGNQDGHNVEAEIYMDDDGYVRVRDDGEEGQQEMVEFYMDEEGRYPSGGEDI